MLTNSKLSWYLKRGIDHEMSAIQHYSAQANMCYLWGLNNEAEKFKEEAEEEFEHASRLISFLLKIGLTPSDTQLKPVPNTKSLHDILIVDWQLEKEVVDLYSEAADFCQKNGLEEAFNLFNNLLKDELHHLKSIETWIQELD